MAIKSDAESVKVLPSDNQNITSEAPKLLLCSSIASGSDLGSNEGVTPLAGIGKEYGSPDKPGGLSIQLCKSEKKEFYIRYSS